MKTRIGILLSGSGSTYANLVEAIESRQLPAEIGLVLSSRADAGGLKRAAAYGHRHLLAQESAQINQLLLQEDCQMILLCGFMRRFDAHPDIQGPVLNIHPSLIPAFAGRGFYGSRVHRAVLEQGVKCSGCSVHLVEGDYDSGPILAQRTVPVFRDDDLHSLQERVQAAERHLYPLVVESILAHGIIGEGRKRSLRWITGCDSHDLGFERDS